MDRLHLLSQYLCHPFDVGNHVCKVRLVEARPDSSGSSFYGTRRACGFDSFSRPYVVKGSTGHPYYGEQAPYCPAHSSLLRHHATEQGSHTPYIIPPTMYGY